MSDLKKLKVARPSMKGYTGVLGRARFINGVSTEALPRHIRDQMAAAMPLLEINEDGTEQPAGSHNRAMRERAKQLSAPKLNRQSVESKAAEIARDIMSKTKHPEIDTREKLEAIASEGGIKALREVGKKWNVKHRSIPALIDLIIEAQKAALAKKQKGIEEAVVKCEIVAETASTEPTVDASAEPAAPTEPAAPAELADAVANAAASGDLLAAIVVESEAAGEILVGDEYDTDPEGVIDPEDVPGKEVSE